MKHCVATFDNWRWGVCKLVVALVVFMASGCGQEQKVDQSTTPPARATVDYDSPGSRIDATFQSVDPE